MTFVKLETHDGDLFAQPTSIKDMLLVDKYKEAVRNTTYFSEESINLLIQIKQEVPFVVNEIH